MLRAVFNRQQVGLKLDAVANLPHKRLEGAVGQRVELNLQVSLVFEDNRKHEMHQQLEVFRGCESHEVLVIQLSLLSVPQKLKAAGPQVEVKAVGKANLTGELVQLLNGVVDVPDLIAANCQCLLNLFVARLDLVGNLEHENRMVIALDVFVQDAQVVDHFDGEGIGAKHFVAAPDGFFVRFFLNSPDNLPLRELCLIQIDLGLFLCGKNELRVQLN